MKTILYLLIASILLVSCSTQKEEKADSSNNIPQLNWGILEIVISNDLVKERVGIFSDNDTCRYNKIIKDTNHLKKYGSYPHEEHVFIITPQEKVEIYACFKDIINNPVPATSLVSCYAGDNVSFRLNSMGNPEVNCNYSSVDDWQNISPSINKLYNLTIKKVSEH